MYECKRSTIVTLIPKVEKFQLEPKDKVIIKKVNKNVVLGIIPMGVFCYPFKMSKSQMDKNFKEV